MKLRLLSSLAVALTGAGLSLAGDAPPAPSPSPPIVTLPADSTVSSGAAGVLLTGPAPAGACQAPCMELLDSGPQIPKRWLIPQAMIYYVKDAPIRRPLATTATGSGRGELDQADTRVLLGGTDYDYGTFFGGRLDSGTWLNKAKTIGLDGTSFILEQRAIIEQFGTDAAGVPLLARPFQDLDGSEGAFTPGIPGTAASSIAFKMDTRLWNTDNSLIFNVKRTATCDFNFLIGYRYTYLRENLEVYNSITDIQGGTFAFQNVPLGAGDQLFVQDSIHTHNDIYNGMLGFRGSYIVNDQLELGLSAKIGLGWNTQRFFQFAGTTHTTPAGGREHSSGGFLVQHGSNAGRFEQDTFIFVPEMIGSVSYRLSEKLWLYASYSFMYFSNVARPGDQIDPVVNPTFVPYGFPPPAGAARPQVLLRTSDYFAHGINLGLQLRF